MAERKSKFISILFRKRRLIQILSLMLLIGIPVFNLFQFIFVTGNYYSLRIWKIEFADPLFALQYFLLTYKLPLSLIIGVIVPLMLAFFAGKLFCSFLCPYNLLAEWLQKITPNKPITHQVHSRRYWLILTGWLILTLLAGFPVLYFVSMPGQIGVFFSDLIFLKVVGFESLIIVILLLSDVLLFRRIWCRELCPVGALLQRFHFKKGLRIEYNEFDCICSPDEVDSPCIKKCPVYLNPKSTKIYPVCFNCGACVQECYFYGEALKITFFNFSTTILPHYKTKREKQSIN